MRRSTHESSRRVSMSRMREQRKKSFHNVVVLSGEKVSSRLQLISENDSVNGVMFIVFTEGKITIVYIIDIICKQCSDIIMSLSPCCFCLNAFGKHLSINRMIHSCLETAR